MPNDFSEITCMADLIKLYRDNPERYKLWDERSLREYLLQLYRRTNG